MAVNKEPIFVGVGQGHLNFILGNGGQSAEIIIWPGDATYGTRVDCLGITTSDGTARDVRVILNNGASAWGIAVVSIPASSGNLNSVPAVDLLRAAAMSGYVQTDAVGNKFLNLPAGWSVRLIWLANTNGAYLWSHARGGRYADA